ncbi:hypothetical protein [Caudoviricetes sp.]|nr:hypothetical protein [Caudoviricetes sp.]
MPLPRPASRLRSLRCSLWLPCSLSFRDSLCERLSLTSSLNHR